MLREVVRRTIDFSAPPQEVARQSARLKSVNKTFRSLTDDVLLQAPEATREALASEALVTEALANRVMHGINKAEEEWARRGWAPSEKKKIVAHFAQALRGLDRVVVRLVDIGMHVQPAEMRGLTRHEHIPQVVEVVMDALARHPDLRTLEVTVREEQQLSCMAQLVGKRPDLLRSLVVKAPDSLSGHSEASLRARTALSKVLPKQKYLATLKLQSSLGRPQLNLWVAHLDAAIAALPGLKSLALSDYQLTQRDADALAAILQQKPTLEDLDLSDNVVDAANFAQIASSLPAVAGLRSLNLQNTSLTGASAEHLAQVLPGLANLRGLNLATTGMVAADMAHLAAGLAGMQQLQTLDVSHNRLDQDGRSHLIAALAHVPTLRHLHLRANLLERPPNLDTLKQDLAPLEGNRELHVYLSRPSVHQVVERQHMARLQAEMPRLHFIE